MEMDGEDADSQDGAGGGETPSAATASGSTPLPQTDFLSDPDAVMRTVDEMPQETFGKAEDVGDGTADATMAGGEGDCEWNHIHYSLAHTSGEVGTCGLRMPSCCHL